LESEIYNQTNQKSIVISPTTASLRRMTEQLDSVLASKGITKGSEEEDKFIKTSSNAAKSRVFPFLKNRDNIPVEYPKSQTIIPITNYNGGTFYLKFGGSTPIALLADNSEMIDAIKIKLIAVTDNLFAFSGDYEEGTTTVATITGGAKKRKRVRKMFEKLMDKYGDIDVASYNLIGRVGMKSDVKSVVKYYSGDFVNTAFSLAFAEDTESFDIDESDNVSDADIDDVHVSITNQYKIQKARVSMDKICSAVKGIFTAKNRTSNKGVLNNVVKMYSELKLNRNNLVSDIATIICRQNNSVNSMKMAFAANDEISAILDNPNGGNGDGPDTYLFKYDSVTRTSPFINMLHSTIGVNPCVSMKSREFIPLLPTFKRRLVATKMVKPASAQGSGIEIDIIGDDKQGDASSGDEDIANAIEAGSDGEEPIEDFY
jgi:hypothetical protein